MLTLILEKKNNQIFLKKKEMLIKKKPECAVFIFSDTWGEIDTVLPLLFDIKKNKPKGNFYIY